MASEISTADKPARNFIARNARKANTRRRLMEEAVLLLRRHGFADLNIDAVAKAAGTNRTTFYLHFKGKPDLILSIAELVREDAEAAFAKLDIGNISLKSVEEWIGAVEAIYIKQASLIDAVQAVLAATPESAAVFDEIANSYIDAIASAQPETKSDAARSRLLSAYILVERYMFYRIIRGHSVGGETMRANLAAIVYDLLAESA